MIVDLGSPVVPDGEQEREDYLAGMLANYVKLRDFPRDQVQWCVPKLSLDLHGLWIGTLDRGLSKANDGSLSMPLGWDCCITVITDGRYVGIQMNAREDDGSTEGGGSGGGNPQPWKPSDGYPKKSRFDE